MERKAANSDEDDRAAVRRHLAGDPHAAGELVSRYQKSLFTVALRMLGNAQDAEDVVQMVFGQVFRELQRYDPSHRFFSWVYRMTVNAALNLQRDRKPVVTINQDADIPGVVAQTDDAFIVEEQVSTALAQLKPDDRSIVVLRYFQSLSYDEIADVLGIPAKTVKSRLFTARDRLRVLLLAHEG